jgi:tRNA pseudouridine55 synthase
MGLSVHGLLVIDKPGGMTSRDAVNRIQGWFPRGTRIGHAGTLDPLATGVLIVCIGQATRLTEYVQRMEKTYRARLLLGARSDTDDAEGQVTPLPGAKPPAPDEVVHQLQCFVGEIAQIPPAFSAAKVTGRRAYDLARQGQDVDLQPRTVHIHGIGLLAYDYPHLEIEVRCGKGTYIRSLARDLGERLGCGALIESLRRTRIEPFQVEDAIGLDLPGETARGHLLPTAQALHDLPRLVLETAEIERLRKGQRIHWHDSGLGQELAIFDRNGVLIAVADFDPVQQTLHANKVLNLGMEGI